MHARCFVLFDTSARVLWHGELQLVLACSYSGLLTGDVSDGGLKVETIPWEPLRVSIDDPALFTSLQLYVG